MIVSIGAILMQGDIWNARVAAHYTPVLHSTWSVVNQPPN